VRDRNSHPYKTAGNIIRTFVLFRLLGIWRESGMMEDIERNGTTNFFNLKSVLDFETAIFFLSSR
jgi:hypothetical protein